MCGIFHCGLPAILIQSACSRYVYDRSLGCWCPSLFTLSDTHTHTHTAKSFTLPLLHSCSLTHSTLSLSLSCSRTYKHTPPLVFFHKNTITAKCDITTIIINNINADDMLGIHCTGRQSTSFSWQGAGESPRLRGASKAGRRDGARMGLLEDKCQVAGPPVTKRSLEGRVLGFLEVVGSSSDQQKGGCEHGHGGARV